MVMTFYIFEMNEYILSLSLCRTDVFVKPFQAECQVQINQGLYKNRTIVENKIG